MSEIRVGYIVSALLFCAVMLTTPVMAQSDAGPIPARVISFDGAVMVQRVAESGLESALVNLPLIEGDRLWTKEDGRVEIQVAGFTLYLDVQSTLDIVSLPKRDESLIIVRLWAGSMIVDGVFPSDIGDDGTVLRVDTSQGYLVLSMDGEYRVDIEVAHRVLFSVYRGSGSLIVDEYQQDVSAGYQSIVEDGYTPSEPNPFNTAVSDDLVAWRMDQRTDSVTVEYVQSREYIPRYVYRYVADLRNNGSWQYHPGFGAWYWKPNVVSTWAPYRYGRWVYTPYGWTWVSSVRWGYVTSHYGRWHRLGGGGWVWFPGSVYSPAWVEWYIGARYVAWTPLDYHDRPTRSYGSSQRHVGPIGSASERGRVINGSGYTNNDRALTVIEREKFALDDPHRFAMDNTRIAVLRGSGGDQPRIVRGSLREKEPMSLGGLAKLRGEANKMGVQQTRRQPSIPSFREIKLRASRPSRSTTQKATRRIPTSTTRAPARSVEGRSPIVSERRIPFVRNTTIRRQPTPRQRTTVRSTQPSNGPVRRPSSVDRLPTSRRRPAVGRSSVVRPRPQPRVVSPPREGPRSGTSVSAPRRVRQRPVKKKKSDS